MHGGLAPPPLVSKRLSGWGFVSCIELRVRWRGSFLIFLGRLVFSTPKHGAGSKLFAQLCREIGVPTQCLSFQFLHQPFLTAELQSTKAYTFKSLHLCSKFSKRVRMLNPLILNSGFESSKLLFLKVMVIVYWEKHSVSFNSCSVQ